MIAGKAIRRIVTAALMVGAGHAAIAQEMTQERIAVAITEAVGSYNPYSYSVVLLGSTWCQIYGCITRFDYEQGRFVPFLAESVEAENELNWLIRLRSNWVRHNGERVLAEDVVHSIERTRSDPASMLGYVVDDIVKAEIVDELTVRLTTKAPMVTLPDNLSSLIVTSKRLFDEYGEAADRKQPHGAGPYRLNEVSVGNHIIVERVDDHPLVVPDNPRQILYRTMPEPEARVTALSNGEVQIAQAIPPQLIERVEGLGNARIELTESVEMMFLAMNPSKHPWNVLAARQAAAHAINREGIVRALLGGRATVLNGPVGAAQIGYDPDFRTPYNYDPARARELLEGAGLLGVEIDFYTPVGRYTADRQIAEAMVPMLEEAGFRVNLRTPEWATLWSDVQAGGVPFFYMGRGYMLDPSQALQQYFETGASPRLDYSNPQIDALLQAERREFDPDRRTEALRKAIRALTEDVPAHFLWLHQMAWGVAKNVDFKPRPADHVNGWEIHIRAGG